MNKMCYPAKAWKGFLALCLVLCLSLAFLSVSAYASGVVIIGGDSDDSSGGDVIVDGGSGGNTIITDDVVVLGKNVTVTKSPSGEAVAKGGTAEFVARAENATGRTWRLVSADASNTINASVAPDYFKGLWVDGLYDDKLTLGNIPESMNGWYVECKFEGAGGPVYTSGAKITVTGATGTTNDPGNTNNNTNNNTGNGQASNTIGDQKPALPTIESQPQGTNLQKGQVTSLSVKASGTEGATLNYQWYFNTVNSTNGGTPIAGAINAQYQPAEREGSTFYYVAVWETLNNQTGTKVFSNPVEVKYHNTAGNNGGNTAAGNNNGTTIPNAGGLTIDVGPAGNNGTANVGNAQTQTPAGESQLNGQTPAQNTANNEGGESGGGSTAVVMLVIALVALVACLGLVVKSGLLPKR